MPRNPAAKKNQHNNRHENGLVGPGKRIAKQKSNGHLNGSVKPSLPEEPNPTLTRNNSLPNGRHTTVPTIPSKLDAPFELRKRASESDADGHEAKWDASNGSATLHHRGSEMAPVKSRSVQDVNALQLASTILKSCPASDTVSLLIVLLALPSLVLTLVQFLFASLTLMPPTNLSPGSFLSLFDVFQNSAGSPSLYTMAAVDFLCFALWLCLWKWAQNFTIDLAQIQIAMTLGNGNSGKSDGVGAFCFAIVLVLHAVRDPEIRRFFVTNLAPGSLLSDTALSGLSRYLPSESDFGGGLSPPGKIKSFIAIHILSQTLMAFVRRRVASSQIGTSSKSSKRGENDTFTGSSHGLEPLTIDTNNVTMSSAVDHQFPPTPGFKDSKDKNLSAKKRRRQANQVRSRQPFWAALASTKVHVLREVEQKGQPGLTADSQMVTPQPSQETVWIIGVEPSSIYFEAMLTLPPNFDPEAVDSKPFFIRINGARWSSVSLDPLDSDHSQGRERTRWTGSISGLAPDCTYTCSFNRMDCEEEFASVAVKTPALVDGDLPSSLVAAPSRGSLRPSSPTTTLKASIQAHELKLAEAKGKLNKAKRAHRTALSRIEKEVESLNARLKSSSDDQRQKQKLLQAQRNTRQTEEQTQAIITALEELDALPEDDTEDYDKKKAAYKAQSKLVAEATETLEAAKAMAKNELSCVNKELSDAISRKERLQAKQAKLTEQHDRITQANAQGMDEKERKKNETLNAELARQAQEGQMVNRNSMLERDLQAVSEQITACYYEIETLQNHAQYAQRDMMLNNGPLTPEGNLPGTNPLQARQYLFSNHPAGFVPTAMHSSEAQSSPFLAYANTLPSGQRPRSNTNRSNGATSNFSAEFEDADPIPPMPSSTIFESVGLSDRKSSGSSRGKNNGSPAGIIGDNLRSPQRGTNSPGHAVQNTMTW